MGGVLARSFAPCGVQRDAAYGHADFSAKPGEMGPLETPCYGQQELAMTKEATAIVGLVAALIGLAITLSGHWIIGNLLSVGGVALSIALLMKRSD
jgi:hypothetical protein